MTREEFFALKNKGALWDVGVSINRTNPLPLDKNAVFDTYDNALTYAKGVLAYPGQFIAVVGETTVDAYLITVAGSANAALIKLASTTASGDLAGDVAALQTKVNNLIDSVGKLEAELGKTVKSVNAGDNSIEVTGTTTAPSIAVKIAPDKTNSIKLDTTNGLYIDNPAVTLEQLTTATDGMLKTYELKQYGASLGKIEIPKDFLVKDAIIGTVTVAGKPYAGAVVGEKYIDFTINAKEDAEAKDVKHLYIPLNDIFSGLAGSTGDEIKVDVNGNIISATLTDTVKTSLNKANSAVQKIVAGTTNGTIKVDGAEVAVAGLQDAAYQTAKHFEDDAQTKADKVKTDIIGKSTDAADADTIYGAKKYADGLNAGIDTRVDTLETKVDVNKVSTAIGTAKTEAIETADTNATTKITAAKTAILGEEGYSHTVKDAYDLAAGKTTMADVEAKGYATKTYVDTQDAALLGATADAWTSKKTIYAVHNEIAEAQDALNNTIDGVSATAAAAKEKAEANETAIGTLNGTGDGSVAKQITTAINKLNANDADATGVVRKVTQENGIITAHHGQVTADDISPIPHTKIKDWDTELGKKQDALEFNTAYNATNNKVATMTDVNNAISGLSGAMHYIGDSTTDPTLEAGPTVTGHSGAYTKGDVVTYNKKEFVYDGTKWRELGDEGSYALKDSVYTKTEANNTFVKQETGKRLMTNTEGNTLLSVSQDLQVTAEASSIDVDGTSIEIANNKLGVKQVNVNKLFIAEGDTLVLNGGTALS